MADLVFVVGPVRSRQKKAIFRFIHRVSRSWNNFKVASIHFTTKYDSNKSESVFLSRVANFTNSTYPSKISELLQVPGNPLQHVSQLDFRNDAIKICFLITNTLPFHDSYKDSTQESTDNEHTTINSNNINTSEEEIYYEDPLFTCRQLAAMGITLHCIDESNRYATFCRDIYAAFTYITGGQYILLDKITNLQKILQNIILGAISLERQIGQTRDYLCVAWHSWSRKRERIPESLEDLTDNIVNHFHNINVMTNEVLVGENSTQEPSKLAKKIAESSHVIEARNLSDTQKNFCTELNWLTEMCDEVIPGYNSDQPKKQVTEVLISKNKLISRGEVSRLLTLVLTRKPELKHQIKTQQWSQMTIIYNNNQVISTPTSTDAFNPLSHQANDINKKQILSREEKFSKTMELSKEKEIKVTNR